MAGVLHVIVKGHWSALAEVRFTPGDGWIVAGTLSWAAYALLQKTWPSPLGATARLAAICWGAMPFLLAGTAWEVLQPGTPRLSMAAWGLGLAAALIPGIGAYWLYGWAQEILGASKVGVTLYLGPLYGALVSGLVLHESLAWHHLVAAILILPGVYLVTRTGVRSSHDAM